MARGCSVGAPKGVLNNDAIMFWSSGRTTSRGRSPTQPSTIPLKELCPRGK
jgi:hypothetical protein